MTIDDRIRSLLAALPQGEELDFFALLQALDGSRFTGPVTFDFLNGKPRQINLGQPVKLVICHGEARDGLDTTPRSRTG